MIMEKRGKFYIIIGTFILFLFIVALILIYPVAAQQTQKQICADFDNDNTVAFSDFFLFADKNTEY